MKISQVTFKKVFLNRKIKNSVSFCLFHRCKDLIICVKMHFMDFTSHFAVLSAGCVSNLDEDN